MRYVYNLFRLRSSAEVYQCPCGTLERAQERAAIAEPVRWERTDLDWLGFRDGEVTAAYRIERTLVR